VQEWVQDWFAPEYPMISAANPKGPDMGDMRVVRGGAYVHGRAWLRGAARDREPPAGRAPWVGFRCARDARRS
jgi:formylglycine-generating enzyme required for sulfatase activity